MNLLKIPEKQPAYRGHRHHSDFITRLKEHIDSPEAFFRVVERRLSDIFSVQHVSMNDILPLVDKYDGRKTTRPVDVD